MINSLTMKDFKHNIKALDAGILIASLRRKQGSYMFLILSIIAVVSIFTLDKLLTIRKEVSSVGLEMSQSIIKEVEAQSQKEYKDYYSQFDVESNGQKVLDRVDNVVVVNFSNQYKALLKRNNIQVG